MGEPGRGVPQLHREGIVIEWVCWSWYYRQATKQGKLIRSWLPHDKLDEQATDKWVNLGWGCYNWTEKGLSLNGLDDLGIIQTKQRWTDYRSRLPHERLDVRQINGWTGVGVPQFGREGIVIGMGQMVQEPGVLLLPQYRVSQKEWYITSEKY